MFSKSKPVIDLNRVGIATPCTMSWERMHGDARVRHCGDCKLNVFNVSEMSKTDAEALIARSLKGERVCVRLQRRDDGTILTRDCPTGVRRVRRQRLGISAACAAVFSLFLGVFAQRSQAQDATMGAPVAEKAVSPNHDRGEWMGEMAVDEQPPPQPKPKPRVKRPREALMGKMVVDPLSTKTAPPSKGK